MQYKSGNVSAIPGNDLKWPQQNFRILIYLNCFICLSLRRVEVHNTPKIYLCHAFLRGPG